MLFRSIFFVLLLSSVSTAQLDRFEEDDIGKWALIARIATDFEEFGLTSSQLDKLKESDIKNAYHHFRLDDQAESAQDFLKTVYEVLDEQQETRLHEIMFQRWMNRDELGIALKAFAPNEVKDLDSKVSELKSRIDKRREDTIFDLPADRKEHQTPLVDFLAWRWEQQVDWLKKELGPVRTQGLVGEPIVLAYKFITTGDGLDPLGGGGRNQFGEPSAGGLYFGSSGGSWGSSSGVEHTTVGPFNPATGKLVKPDLKKLAEARRNGTGRPKRPVDVPKGWTLDDAWKNLREIEQRSDELTGEYADQINVRRRGRGGFEERRVLESQLRVEGGLLSVEIEKAERIVEELGGDPQAEVKEIREAQRVLNPRGFYCNQQPFVSHLNVTAEQHNALDEIADEYGTNVHQFSEEEKFDYNQAVLKVLDKKQQRLMKQVLFRQYWFSENCELAFEITKVKLTDEQKEKVATLATLLRDTNQEIRDSHRDSRRFMRPMFGMRRPNREKHNKPLVAVAKKFNETLEELVGAKNAAALLGEPMERDSEWKRPVVVPQGLTVQQAKEQYDELAAELKDIQDKGENMFRDLISQGGGLGNINIQATMQESQERLQQLQRKTEIAKRVYEELQAAEGK